MPKQPRQPIGARRSTRLQAQVSLNPPSSYVSQPQRSETDESETALPPPAELSKKNLRKFNGEEMNSASDIASTASTDITQETGSIRSQRSSGSNAYYRYHDLAAAEVYIHDPSPPADIRARIDAIIKAKVSEERQAKLLAISQKLHDGLLENALHDMDHSKLNFRRKADWRVELKPTIHQPTFDLSRLGYRQEEIPDRDKNTSPIKTPRPDITIGLEETTLISALSSQNLNSDEASEFLKFLQYTMIRREPDGLDEPKLCLVPTQELTGLVFPFLIIEGNGYSTSKSIFEAENRAAVSGACGLKILLFLDELVSSDVLPTPLNPIPHLLFSICTKGPFYELWAHYTTTEDGVREYHMLLLKTCHEVLLEGLVDFLIAVDNVFRWATGEFLDGVVERLGKVKTNERA